MKKNNSQLYHSKKWRDFRKLFLIDNYKCFICNSTFNLEIDHIVEHEENEKLFYNKNNLQTLCKSCHFVKTMTDKKIQTNFKISKKFIVKINEDHIFENLKVYEKFYSWKREKELTKRIVQETITNEHYNFSLFILKIKNLEFWKIKKILDCFCFELKEIPIIFYQNKEYKIRDFLIIFLNKT